MSKLDKKKIESVIHTLGLKYNLTDEVIKNLVNSPYLFTFLKIKEIDLSEIKTEEELNDIKTNFIYRNFAKIYVSFPLINRRNKQKENIINLNKNK